MGAMRTSDLMNKGLRQIINVILNKNLVMHENFRLDE